MREGIPDGLKIVEKDSWDGVGLVIPRPRYSANRAIPHLGKPGVYCLIGEPKDEDAIPQIYVGEGDCVRDRLDEHAAKKPFWTTAIVFVSSSDRLNKAHVQHLEARLYELAEKAKKSTILNGNQPQAPMLSEQHVAQAELFLDECLLVASVLGVEVFDRPSSSKADASATLLLKEKGVVARGYESDDGFVVMTGSQASTTETASTYARTKALRKTLQESGVLAAEDGKLVFRQNYEFNSPSEAAGVVVGQSINGRDVWKDSASGKSLNELAQVELNSGGTAIVQNGKL